MNERLKKSRYAAGYKTASAAIEKFGWKSSAYRAHENGQNNFSTQDALTYANAYDVTAAWLLVGEDSENSEKAEPKERRAKPITHNHDCAEHIHAMALLLREDSENMTLIRKIQECAVSQMNKVSTQEKA